MPTRCGARPDTEPCRSQHRPPLGRGALLPLVVRGGRRPDRLQRPVVGNQPGDVGDLGHEGGVVGVDVQPGGQPAQVAHGQAAGAQHARRAGAPVGRRPRRPGRAGPRPGRRRRRRPSRPACVVSASGGGSRSRRRCSRSPRSRRATSRGTTTWSAESGLISWCASSQAPAVAVGPAVPRTPTGGPTSGGPGWRVPPAGPAPPARRSPRRWRGWPGPDPRSSTNDGPSPAGCGPERLGDRAHHVQPVGAAPEQRRRPQGVDEGLHRAGRLPQQRRGPGEVDRVAGDGEGLQHLQVARGPGRPARAARWPGCRPAPRAR